MAARLLSEGDTISMNGEVTRVSISLACSLLGESPFASSTGWLNCLLPSCGGEMATG